MRAARCWTSIYDWDSLPVPSSLEAFEEKWSRRHEPLCFSGVWRFSDLLPFAPPNKIVTIGEGQTLLHPSDGVARYVGVQPGTCSCNTRA